MADLDDRAAPVNFDLRREDGDQATLLKLEGELDLSNIDALRGAVEPMIERRPDRLIIDATGLRFADSSAIAALVAWSGVVDDIEIQNPPNILRGIIESMGLTETLPMRP